MRDTVFLLFSLSPQEREKEVSPLTRNSVVSYFEGPFSLSATSLYILTPYVHFQPFNPLYMGSHVMLFGCSKYTKQGLNSCLTTKTKTSHGRNVLSVSLTSIVTLLTVDIHLMGDNFPYLHLDVLLRRNRTYQEWQLFSAKGCKIQHRSSDHVV